MSWEAVGKFLSNNAEAGVGLVGSLLTGNIVGAVSSGMAMVSQATGTTDSEKALHELTNNPETMIKLKQLQLDNEKEINRHIETIYLAELKDMQAEHKQTQETIMNGDNATGLIKWVRPLFCGLALCASIYHIETVSWEKLSILMSLPLSYCGLRTLDKRGVGLKSILKKTG